MPQLVASISNTFDVGLKFKPFRPTLVALLLSAGGTTFPTLKATTFEMSISNVIKFSRLLILREGK